MTTKKDDAVSRSLKARKTPAPQEPDRRDSGLPGGGQGRVDKTGIMPPGVHIDPDITEGHPGYQESGESEIIPMERLTKGNTSAEQDKNR
jgi:hypothetical protein